MKRGCAGLQLPSDPFGEVKREERESEPWEPLTFPHAHLPPCEEQPAVSKPQPKVWLLQGCDVCKYPLDLGPQVGAHLPLQEGRRGLAAACDGCWRQAGNFDFPFGSGLIEHLRVTSQQKQLDRQVHTLSLFNSPMGHQYRKRNPARSPQGHPTDLRGPDTPLTRQPTDVLSMVASCFSCILL